jgi:phosphate starvation-inducible PhoH-like protein
MKTITLDAKVIEAITADYDEALRLIEDRFNVRLVARGNDVTVTADGNGERERVDRVADLLDQLALLHAKGIDLGRDDLRTAVTLIERQPTARLVDHFLGARIRTSAKKTIVAKSPNQRRYVEAIRNNDLVFGIGPAGTGKTYLAVAMAVALLNEKRVKRIILARPAVEAGENLGFLPGDLAAKVDPYLRPLYDALYDMLEPHRAERLMEQGAIEVAPLAFMRGRTLDHSIMILDEAQNTTSEQMKMFLTRIGFDSKAVVTGDVTQIDLPAPKRSGLIEARQIVQGIRGTEFVHFDERDVVRHPLVQRIVLAYERHGQASENGRGLEADAAAVSRARVSETRPTPAADAVRGETEDDR